MRFDPHYVSNLNQSLNASSLNEQTLTQQLSSGLRVSNLSGDPVAAAQNVLLSSSISQSDSYVQGASHQEAQLQVTDSALGQVVTDVTSVLSLAVSAGDGTITASNLSSIAGQVSSLRDSILSLANTSYLGQYVFAGSQGSTQPFVLDTSSDPATTTYQGDNVAQSIATPSGQKIQVNLPGTAIFSAPGSDLLGSINQLVSDLTNGNTSAVSADTNAISNALSTVNTQRSVLGGSLSQINGSSSYVSTQEAQMKVQQSTLLASDPTTVATGLSNAEVQSQSLLSVIATLSKRETLFDALN